MPKRKYTHIKELEVQILSMRESGMTRQEIADELGLEKGQIKNWIARYNRRGSLLLREPKQKAKDGLKKMDSHQCRIFKGNWNGSVWRINCCGIFCAQQKGCEAKDEVCNNQSAPGRIPGNCYVQILLCFPKWLL